MLTWFALLLAVAGGVVLGGHWAAPTAVVAAVGGAALILVARSRAAVAGWVLLAALRGLLAARPGGEEPWRVPSGPVAPLRVVADGSSEPGPTCRVPVRAPGGGVRVLVELPPEVCPVARGETILLARVGERRGQAWPGGPDAAALARRFGASAVVRARWARRGAGGAGPLAAAVPRVRQEAWARSRGDAAASFLAASTLGLVRALSPERRGELRAAGLGHLVAVSGLHVGVTAGLVAALVTRLCPWGVAARLLTPALALLPLVAYVALTGGAPPAVRAGLMAGMGAVGAAMGRPTHGPTALLAAAATMALARPAWCLAPGFHLTLVAMAALVTARADAGLLTRSVRVGWAVAPVAFAHFGDAAAAGVLANLVAIPVFALWVLPLAMLGFVLDGLWQVPLALARWGAALLLDLAHLLAAAPRVPVGVLALLGAGVMVGHRLLVRAGRVADGPGPVPLASVLALGVLAAFERTPRPAPEALWLLHGKVAPAWVHVAPGGASCAPSPPPAPLVDAVAAAGGRVPIPVRPGEPCPEPARARVRAARRRCGRSVALMALRPGEIACWEAGGWRVLRDPTGERPGRKDV